MTAYNNSTLRTVVNYTTPSTMVANSRHLVADLAGGYYSVTSSVSGTIKSGQYVNESDHTLLFVVPIGGAQIISIVKTADGVNGSVDDSTPSTIGWE